MKYITTFFLVIIFGALIYAGISKFTGIVGRTEKNGVGCTCHNVQRDNSVQVQITGPDTLIKGQSGEYQITLSGGPAVQGGFNVASFLGTLSPVDASSQLMLSELTHTNPKTFSGGSVSWSFNFTAANQVYTDTIFSAGNSVNGDGFNNSLDRWNFGQRFVVHVIDQVSSVEDENVIAKDFILDQNYPNPFNPSTSIQYAVSSPQFVSLKVYDAAGKEVATLVYEYKPAGSYNVQFTTSGLQLSSGVYYYRLQAGDPSASIGQSFVETKKMILLK
jgi:hypothetical protein